MPTYQNIANSEIDADSPITASVLTRLRDNPEAVRAGDPTAPRIVYAAETLGGSGLDGVGAAMPGLSGIYDYTSFAAAGVQATPNLMILRCTGDVNLAGVTLNLATLTGVAQASASAAVSGLFGARAIPPHASFGAAGGYPGLGSAANPWRSMAPTLPGGNFQDTFQSVLAGTLVIIAEGNINLAGATINANGVNGGGGGGNNGGGGGGIIKAYAVGDVNVTGLTANLTGGAGAGAGVGGGGGFLAAIGSSVTGAPTLNAGGGAGTPAGGAGAYQSAVLTVNQIKSLIRGR